MMGSCDDALDMSIGSSLTYPMGRHNFASWFGAAAGHRHHCRAIDGFCRRDYQISVLNCWFLGNTTTSTVLLFVRFFFFHPWLRNLVYLYALLHMRGIPYDLSPLMTNNIRRCGSSNSRKGKITDLNNKKLTYLEHQRFPLCRNECHR